MSEEILHPDPLQDTTIPAKAHLLVAGMPHWKSGNEKCLYARSHSVEGAIRVKINSIVGVVVGLETPSH